VTHNPTLTAPGNRILELIPADDLRTLLNRADYVDYPVGHVFARTADPFSTVFFPDSGVISVKNEMTTGHHLAIAVVGSDGLIGLGPLFGVHHYPLSLVVLMESSGYSVPSRVFTDLFHQSHAVRQVVMTHIGYRMWELTVAAACNRVHSHRQRLARWLLTITGKAAVSSLPMTHDSLAELVGGPRHAVTVALNALSRRGAIAHARGRIDVLDRSLLSSHACECYIPPTSTSLYRPSE